MTANQACNIVAVWPQICGGGGIERVCRTAMGVMEQFARRHQLKPYVNDSSGGIHPAGSPEHLRFVGFRGDKIRCAWSILRLARSTRILFLGHPYLAPLGFLASVLNPSLRYGVMAHGLEVWQRLSPVRREALRRAALVVTPSRYTAEKVVSIQGVSQERVRIVPHGMETPLPRGGRPHQTSHPGIVLLSVARMASTERLKGIDAVIRSLRPVVARTPELTYFVAGEGDDRPRLEALARECGVECKVIFTGRIADSELWDRYASCDIFVLPSASEGFGMVFVEAMAFGKPVIASRTGAAPEIVTDGVNGFLVEGQDEAALSGRILQLAADPELRTRMGQAAQVTFENHYSLEKYQVRFTDFLKELAF